jgi:glycerol-3-phosphate cytidylyltransferase
MKKILVDMSATLIHHGHIRLLKKASRKGKVIVALTNDKEIKKHKKITPEISFRFRKEILESIIYVSKVIESPFFINKNFLKKNNIDLLVHGSDNKNQIPKNKLITFKRTNGISSTKIRKKACKNQKTR